MTSSLFWEGHSKIKLSPKQAPDDRGLSTVNVVVGKQLGEPLAQVVHLPVQAPDVVAGILQDFGCWHLHHRSKTLVRHL